MSYKIQHATAHLGPKRDFTKAKKPNIPSYPHYDAEVCSSKFLCDQCSGEATA